MESARASAGLAAECRLPLRHRCHRWWRHTVRRLFHEEAYAVVGGAEVDNVGEGGRGTGAPRLL